jgi:adenine-specific DNA methylase
MALIQAGFIVETSWPVETESETSSHQANKNAAESTILLVCRKRDGSTDQKVYLEDLEAEIRETARSAYQRFAEDGIDGVDLLLATYGPTLSVISQRWPVLSSSPDEDGRSRLLRPEEALDVARVEIVGMQRRRLVGREVQVDDLTDFVLLAWSTFKAVEFPYDEARRLALAVGGLDVETLVREKVLEKKIGTVRLLSPKERVRRGGDGLSGVRIDADRFDNTIDAVHTVLYVAAVDGIGQAKAMMDRLGLTTDAKFIATVQGLINAIPRTRIKGDWVVAEAGLLDTLAVAYLPDVAIPPEEPSVLNVEAPTLFDA